jgi:hypothetical protein
MIDALCSFKQWMKGNSVNIEVSDCFNRDQSTKKSSIINLQSRYDQESKIKMRSKDWTEMKEIQIQMIIQLLFIHPSTIVYLNSKFSGDPVESDLLMCHPCDHFI